MIVLVQPKIGGFPLMTLSLSFYVHAVSIDLPDSPGSLDAKP